MGWKIYLGFLIVVALLQISGYVISLSKIRYFRIDILSYFFNIGLMILGPFMVYAYAFKKKFANPFMWKIIFYYFLIGVGYAIYFNISKTIHVSLNYALAHYINVALLIIYIPLLFATYKYAWAQIDIRYETSNDNINNMTPLKPEKYIELAREAYIKREYEEAVHNYNLAKINTNLNDRDSHFYEIAKSRKIESNNALQPTAESGGPLC